MATDASPRAPLARLVRDAEASLRASGVPGARREVAIIVGAIRGEPPGAATAAGADLTAAQSDALARAVRRRAGGEPLPYVIGRAGFRHLDLEISAAALIPRPETEGLVELVMQIVRSGGGERIVDVGTGSGCIAISLATELGVSVVATDLSMAALELAARNARTARAGVHFLRGDLVGALAADACDVLVSNPPYLSAGEYAALDPSVRAWEPAPALVSGHDGLEATGRLLAEALRVVRPGGWIALEIDSTRGRETARRARRCGWRRVSIENDLFGRERFLLGRRE